MLSVSVNLQCSQRVQASGELSTVLAAVLATGHNTNRPSAWHGEAKREVSMGVGANVRRNELASFSHDVASIKESDYPYGVDASLSTFADGAGVFEYC